MEPTMQKSLPLILAREFAANLATPMVLMDNQGRLVFFNEPAEQILGQTHAEVGELGPDEWGRLFDVERIDGTPVEIEKTPAGVTLAERRPAHDTLAFRTVDGVRHEIAVTAFPLLGREEELLGVVSIFWEDPDA
jgi:PAS domain S-box-containing protein